MARDCFLRTRMDVPVMGVGGGVWGSGGHCWDGVAGHGGAGGVDGALKLRPTG